MRRDVYINNDSGGFSILAHDAIDAIIEDARSADLSFVTSFKALLLELYGDDSMPVRIVVNEPLRADEDAQWLAKASWQIDASDGRLVVMGGYDPDVLQSWKDATDASADGDGVALVEAMSGSLRVDVYAHTGSMNGRQILSETDERPGAAFRRDYPDRAFPLWLAKMLEFSGEDDPGHEDLWSDVVRSVAEGKLAIDTEGQGAIGFLVHVTRSTEAMGDPPADGWFGRDTNSRVPTMFPIGVPSEVPDPELVSFRDRLLGREAPADEPPVAGGPVEIIEVWSGDPLKSVQGQPPVVLNVTEAYLLHWMAAFTADSPPRFELWVTPKGVWTPPASCADFAVVPKSGSVSALGPSPNLGGWPLWWAARNAASSLAGVPDGSTIDVAMAPRLENDEGNAAVGRALYSGMVTGGRWRVEDASPTVTADTLANAVAFLRDVVERQQLQVRSGGERRAFDRAAKMFSREAGSLVWEGDVVRLAQPDERTLLLLAGSVFRVRFGAAWPVDTEETG